VTVAVTGGAGFLGSRVVAELLARGHRVRCVVRSLGRGVDVTRGVTSPELRNQLQITAGKLENAEFCREFVANCDAVVHIAAPLTGSVSALFANGVVPTRVLVHAASDAGIRRFVLVSSLAVYGTHELSPGAVLDERCPVDRRPHLRDAYTYSKVVQEEVCWEVHNERGLPLVVVRPGVLFGPGRPLLTARIGLTIGRVLIQMGGRQQVPYCFVDNCARAVALAAETPCVDGMIFNLVDDDLPSANAVLRLHQRYVSPVRAIKVPGWAIVPFASACEWGSNRSAGMFPPVLTRYKAAAMWKRLCFSNELAKRRLGWQPTVTFEEGVRRTLSSLAANTATRH
jgi:nucleoside-diphosphate-sugar epimerase